MAIAHIRTFACVALVLATVMGRVVDEGSRQPLVGVRVHVEGPTSKTVTTDKQGNFAVNGLKPGDYVVTAESAKVPSQVFLVNVKDGGMPQAHFLRVCSIEDENCGPPSIGGGHP